jgi:hypothetical protein
VRLYSHPVIAGLTRTVHYARHCGVCTYHPVIAGLTRNPPCPNCDSSDFYDYHDFSATREVRPYHPVIAGLTRTVHYARHCGLDPQSPVCTVIHMICLIAMIVFTTKCTKKEPLLFQAPLVAKIVIIDIPYSLTNTLKIME